MVALTKRFLEQYSNRQTIAVHLKLDGPREESYASSHDWHAFFKNHPDVNFLLLGPIPASHFLFELPNVHQISVPLSYQICLINLVDAFLGMSSGFAAEAILGCTPSVIFKHPLHHLTVMQNELSFIHDLCSDKQFFWQKEDSYENLEVAFQLVAKDTLSCRK